MNTREDELYRLACMAWGQDVGQVIVVKDLVSVHAVNGRILCRIEHANAFRLARVAVRLLARHERAEPAMAPEAPADVLQTESL